MNEWRPPDSLNPDWRLNDKNVEVELKDGKIVAGKLAATDYILVEDEDGIVDEVPIFEIETAPEHWIPMSDVARFRFL